MTVRKEYIVWWRRRRWRGAVVFASVLMLLAPERVFWAVLRVFLLVLGVDLGVEVELASSELLAAVGFRDLATMKLACPAVLRSLPLQESSVQSQGQQCARCETRKARESRTTATSAIFQYNH